MNILFFLRLIKEVYKPYGIQHKGEERNIKSVPSSLYSFEYIPNKPIPQKHRN